MTRLFLASVLALLTTLSGQNASTADASGLFAVKGVGTAPCQRFTQSVRAKDDELMLYVGHVTGYVSAYNQTTADTYDLLAWEDTTTLVNNLLRFCASYPEQSFQVALNEMVKFLRPHVIAQASDTATFGSGDKRVRLYASTVQRLREKLLQLGYVENIDVPDLAASLRRYQQDVGVAETGVPDQATLVRLFYGAPPTHEKPAEKP